VKQVLALSHARKSYDGKVVLDDVTLAFLPGAKIGVVGPNGMGKSTLLKMMAGLEQPSNGDVRRMPGYSIGILPQEPDRARQRRGRRRRDQGPHRAVQPGRGEDGRGVFR
jgi:ATPase subunit of ABC transporter with duplicated ATPase domains